LRKHQDVIEIDLAMVVKMTLNTLHSVNYGIENRKIMIARRRKTVLAELVREGVSALIFTSVNDHRYSGKLKQAVTAN